MKIRKMLAITSLVAMLGLVLVSADAWARASGGGSRGSRSFSAPARPSSPASPTTPSSPSRSMSQPAAPMAPQRPSFFSGIMGGIAGFALGGLLGSMLFGGMGGLGRGFGGFGLMEILLIGGGIVLLVMFLRRRRAETPAPAYAGAGGQASAYGAYGGTEQGGGTATITPEMPAAQGGDLERGVSHIRSMDPAFDPVAVGDTARRMFQGVQQAVTMRDIAWIREHLGNEIYAVLQEQCDRLRTAKRTNRVEKIELGGAELTEAWQEGGQDFVTVRLTGSMLDYTVDDASGSVVEGSQSSRADIDEYWTFSRPVGPNRWKLSAIQTA